MFPSLRTILIAVPVVVILDLVWIGWLMAPFYQNNLRPLLNFVNGSLSPRIIPAVLTYVIMILLIACIAVPLSNTFAGGSSIGTFAIGALLGLLVYGLYNLTNYSLVRDWSLIVTIVDTLWGAVIFGLSTLAVRLFS